VIRLVKERWRQRKFNEPVDHVVGLFDGADEHVRALEATGRGRTAHEPADAEVNVAVQILPNRMFRN
jgi:hypothetical protein